MGGAPHLPFKDGLDLGWQLQVLLKREEQEEGPGAWEEAVGAEGKVPPVSALAHVASFYRHRRPGWVLGLGAP